MLTPGVFGPRDPGFITPGSAEHNSVLSPSKIAAVLGVSRFESAYRLWHRMRGITPPEPDKDIFKAGHAYEPALAYLWREENPGWQLSPGEVQVVGDASAYGFPYVATIDRRRRRSRSVGILELKTARSLEDWGDVDLSDECPPDYLLQVIAQQLLTGYRAPAHLMVMGPFFKHHTYKVDYNEDVAAVIIDGCREFWESLRSETVPPLDDSIQTYECVREQHPEIDKDVEAELPVELAAEYHAALAAEEEAKNRSRFAKTQVLDVMERANYAFAGDARVARRQPSSKGSVALYQIKPGSNASTAGAKDEGEPAA